MTTLVDTADDDQILSVAQFLGELDEDGAAHTELADTPSKIFVAKCAALMNDLQWGALLAALLDYAGSLFAKAEAKDIESCLLVMSNMVSKLPEEEAVTASSQIVAATVSDASADSSQLKLRILFNLFNLINYPAVKYSILMRLLSFAASANLADQLLPATKRIDAWGKDWNLTVEESRALYLELANLLRQHQAAQKEAFNYLVKYLATFENTEGAAANVTEQAVRAAKDFIASPDLFQSDLLDMSSISKLQNDPTHGNVFKLLSIFLTGTLADYLQLHAKSPKLVKDLGLSHDECVNKMRLMSLASLGAETPSGEIPYSLVKTTLQVEDSEVESWIVKGIGMKLMEAKMDQLREIVIISRCTHRVFGHDQWIELRSRLAAWQKNLGNVCNQMDKKPAEIMMDQVHGV
mmetsp:Transcript_2666/g.3020  ORF Transcript_2666/g.3020 Transcript_2666/m.3020 type:complete len:408 (-) Transcript_2666:196-1419(-)|eukprot:CAMPEP_0197846810 /NCGR_PEP_ID=MMETSP1438-20131217/4451_1 /TAXON_ID=1461541 /ORGANISM="Pterosperma sp., Strain CCMP1384" /LENGTH=407 /DNA_ID=CAMNT_0043458585 /DNA_START=56 /DNA_END=1279 /DNA_ORIENTATION=-